MNGHWITPISSSSFSSSFYPSFFSSSSFAPKTQRLQSRTHSHHRKMRSHLTLPPHVFASFSIFVSTSRYPKKTRRTRSWFCLPSSRSLEVRIQPFEYVHELPFSLLPSHAWLLSLRSFSRSRSESTLHSRSLCPTLRA